MAVFIPSSSKILIMVFIIVVFPVPGPPVIMEMLFSRARRTPLRCSEESLIFSPVSAQLMRLSRSAGIGGTSASIRRFRLWAVSCSAR